MIDHSNAAFTLANGSNQWTVSSEEWLFDVCHHSLDPLRRFVAPFQYYLISNKRLIVYIFSLSKAEFSFEFWTCYFDFPLIIRPHPRSDIEMLKVIFPMASFENKDVIVNPHLYISHHSAITTLFLKNNIPSILYKVNNEEIPQGISSENSLMIVSKIKKNDYKKIKNFIEEDFVRDKEFFKSKANVTQLIENFVNYSN